MLNVQHMPSEENVMRGNLALIKEALKAIGRIIAGLALLHYHIVFWALRTGLLVSLIAALYRMIREINLMLAVPGMLMIATGAIFTVWTHRQVSESGNAPKLITEGCFSVVRHPMYSGMSLVALGTALTANNLLISILMISYTICMLSFCCAEDEENEQVFGQEYHTYQTQVPLTGIYTGLVKKAIQTGRRHHEKHYERAVL